jgi:hypothetical protein
VTLPLTSKRLASTLPNEAVEVDEPLIVPSYSNPLLNEPLMSEAICAELDKAP